MQVQRHHLPPLLQKNEVLFGHAGAEGLIAIEREGDDKVVLFIRELKVKTKEAQRRCAPFIEDGELKTPPLKLTVEPEAAMT